MLPSLLNRANGNIYFVDSGNTAGALNADDGEHGQTWEKPFATIDYAVGFCTANNGDVILVAPGHAESMGLAGAAAVVLTVDVAGITIIGLGEGAARPTLTNASNVEVVLATVSAANVTIKNLLLYTNVDAVVQQMTVTGSDCTLENVEFRDAASNKETLSQLVATTVSRLHVKDCFFNGSVAGDACLRRIGLAAVTDALIEGCIFKGVASTSEIDLSGTLSTGVKVKDCIFQNTGTALTKNVVDTITGSTWSVINSFDVIGNYTFSGGTGVAVASDDAGAIATAVSGINTDTSKIEDAALTGTPTTSSLSTFIATGGTALGTALPASTSLYDVVKALYKTAAGTGVYPTGVTDDSIIAMMLSKSATASASSYDNTTDSQEAIADAVTLTAKTTELLSAGTNDLNATCKASINTEADSALSDINADHLAKVACGTITDPIGMAEITDHSILANVLTDDGDASDYDRRYHSIESLAKILQIQMGYQMRSIAGSAMPIAIWYVDANIAASGDGKTPATAFKTMQEAITACTTTADDWILVYDYSGGDTATITIDKPFVHIIGNGCRGMAYPRIMPTGNFDGITLTAAADRVEIANMVIGGGTQGYSAIAFDSAAGAYGVYIHDCVLGRDANAPALYGISIPAGSDAPYLVVDNNRFYGSDGAGIAAAGSAIRIAGNATHGEITNNFIQDVGRTATPAIWVDGSGVNLRIEGNRIKTDTDTGTGSAITLSANVDDSWIAGNWASDGKDAPAQNPFVDGGSTNGWAENYSGIVAVLPA